MRLVAVAHRCVKRSEGTLRNAPRRIQPAHAPLLHKQAEARALIKQTVPRKRQQQLRHQIFKHGTRPADHAAINAGGHLRAAETLPVCARHVAPRHGKIPGQPRLAAHQVIPRTAGLARFRVHADMEQTAFFVIEQRKVHLPRQRIRPHGKIGTAIFQQSTAQRDKAGAEVSAVHRGDITRRHRRAVRGLVPVIKMPVPFFQPLQARQHFRKQLHGTLHTDKVQIRRRQHGEQSQTDVRWRGAAAQSRRWLRLKIVRRQVVVLRGKKFRKISPRVPRVITQTLPLLCGKLFGRCGGQREQQRIKRCKNPKQSGGFSDNTGRKQQKRRAKARSEPEHPTELTRIFPSAVALRRSLPLQHPSVADAHPPQRAKGGRQCDPCRAGQQQKPQKRAHDAAAHADKQHGLKALMSAVIAAQHSLQHTKQQLAGQCKQRGGS